MNKSRSLPFDRGITDGKYYSGSMAVGSNYPIDVGAWWAYGVARAANTRTPGTFIGTQNVQGTTRPRPKFNDFENIKIGGFQRAYLIACEQYNRPTQVYLLPCFMSAMSGVVRTLIPGVWSAFDGAQRRAWWSMQPRFEGEVEALNFIFELKDFRNIAKAIGRANIRRSMSKLRGLHRRVKHSVVRFFKDGYKRPKLFRLFDDATTTVAEVHLTKEFAIDPLITDTALLLQQACTLVDKVQKQFQCRGYSPQRSHYTEEIVYNDALTRYTNNNYWFGNGTWQSTIFTATLEYSYEYRLRSRFEAFKAYYGLNVTAEAIWNAIPFSFLVDYFLKVGQAISFMRKDPNVTLKTHQYCESLLSTHSRGIHYVNDSRVREFYCPDVQGDVRLGSLLSGYASTHYLRRNTAPNKGTALPRVTLPTTGQVQNMVALLKVLW